MSETWDTARIRDAFIYDGGESEYHDPINGARTQRRIAGEIFDRWLAAHDAEVRARALDDAEESAAKALAEWWVVDTKPEDDTDSVMEVRYAVRELKAST